MFQCPGHRFLSRCRSAICQASCGGRELAGATPTWEWLVWAPHPGGYSHTDSLDGIDGFWQIEAGKDTNKMNISGGKGRKKTD